MPVWSSLSSGVGGRGYTEGKLYEDTYFDRNVQGALDAGLAVGAYFFSQAITVEEALEEARFVLERVRDYDLTMPVVFDWEHIEGVEEARSNQVDTETVTACAVAFCDRIAQAGYQTAFYCNGMLGYLHYDLSQLERYDAWYAEYASWPSFAYASISGSIPTPATVAGIGRNVDLDSGSRPRAED